MLRLAVLILFVLLADFQDFLPFVFGKFSPLFLGVMAPKLVAASIIRARVRIVCLTVGPIVPPTAAILPLLCSTVGTSPWLDCRVLLVGGT